MQLLSIDQSTSCEVKDHPGIVLNHFWRVSFHRIWLERRHDMHVNRPLNAQLARETELAQMWKRNRECTSTLLITAACMVCVWISLSCSLNSAILWETEQNDLEKASKSFCAGSVVHLPRPKCRMSIWTANWRHLRMISGKAGHLGAVCSNHFLCISSCVTTRTCQTMWGRSESKTGLKLQIDIFGPNVECVPCAGNLKRSHKAGYQTKMNKQKCARLLSNGSSHSWLVNTNLIANKRGTWDNMPTARIQMTPPSFTWMAYELTSMTQSLLATLELVKQPHRTFLKKLLNWDQQPQWNNQSNASPQFWTQITKPPTRQINVLSVSLDWLWKCSTLINMCHQTLLHPDAHSCCLCFTVLNTNNTLSVWPHFTAFAWTNNNHEELCSSVKMGSTPWQEQFLPNN